MNHNTHGPVKRAIHWRDAKAGTNGLLVHRTHGDGLQTHFRNYWNPTTASLKRFTALHIVEFRQY